jgi:hypothetical protein
MQKNTTFTILVLISLLVMGCASLSRYSSSPTRFGPRQNHGLVEYDQIQEASGIVASRNHANVLWLHNDSGIPELYAINTRGEQLGRYILHGCTDVDWEDIAIGPATGSEIDYIYVGAIGDNRRQRQSRSICKIPEPSVAEHQQPTIQNIHDVEVINFRYADGSHDAETLMADPLSGDMYIVTKRVKPAGVYRIPATMATDEMMTLTRIAELPYRYLTGGDISAAGTEILIKSYTTIYYWSRLPGESLEAVFGRRPQTAPYIWEPGGEAVAWSATAQGYYTVSEEKLGIAARLYYYPRLTQ